MLYDYGDDLPKSPRGNPCGAAFWLPGKSRFRLCRRIFRTAHSKVLRGSQKGRKTRNLRPGAAVSWPISEAFNKRFPRIQIEAFDESGQQTHERVIAEQKAGRVIGDVVIPGPRTLMSLAELGLLEAYKSAQIPHMIPELVPEGPSANPFRASVTSMAINTKSVPPADEPKAWADVLDPKFRGKIASDDPRGIGGGGSLMAALEKAYGTEFLRKLAQQNIFFSRDSGTVLAGLVRGEHAIFLTAAYYDIIAARKEGAAVKFLKPKDGLRVGQAPQALVKNAPHPNAGKLWIEWSLSEEGQQMLGKVGLVAARKGIIPAEPEANLTGVALLPTIDTRQGLAEVKERSKRMEAIFFKKN